MWEDVINKVPDVIRDGLNEVLRGGILPGEWKVGKLILLRKLGKMGQHPSVYRPICLLDVMGKLMERILVGRMENWIRGKGGFCDRQYGFMKGLSTVQAVERVVELAKSARMGTWRTREWVTITFLDIQNAFNSAAWSEIKRRCQDI